MPDISALGAAVTAFKALKDIAQTMIGLRDAQAFQSKMIEFQAAVLDAQSSVFAANDERTALIQKISGLETKLAQFEAWETEKQRYELKSVDAGSFAYVLKPEAHGSEPTHWICPSCYQKGEKSILQGINSATFGWTHTCPSCKLEIRS